MTKNGVPEWSEKLYAKPESNKFPTFCINLHHIPLFLVTFARKTAPENQKPKQKISAKANKQKHTTRKNKLYGPY